MKKTIIAAVVATSLLQACSSASVANNTVTVPQELQSLLQQNPTASQQLVALTDDYIEKTLPRNPINAMFFGDNRFNHLWPNNLTPEFIAEGVAIDKSYLAALQQIDYSSLKGQDLYTYDIFKQNLQTNLEGNVYPTQYLPLNQFIFSPHNFFIQLGSGLSAQPFNNVQDFDNFTQRMQAYATWMQQAIVNMRAGIKAGVVQPKPVVESMLPQMKAQVLDNPEQSSLMMPLKNMADKLPTADRQRLEASYKQIIAEQITPAYQAMVEFIEQEYLPNARDTHGYGALPNGEDWYNYQIKVNTTLPLTAEQLHNTGLSEVKRIHKEMLEVAREVGFEGDLKAFFTFLQTDPQFYYTDSEQIIAAYEGLKTKINPLLDKLFSVKPKADYVVRPYPESQAKSAPGASYIPAAKDGSRPGVFFANTYNLKGQPKYGVETLSIHEAVPGHHFQLSLQNEVTGLPKIRTQNFYTVYAEGWALYAESLGKEMGMFTDPYQYYGKLEAELFRAMRLVVDTGIHYKGWSREQAIQYMLDNSTMTESDITAEVERYMVMPGQALAYKTGQLKIQELRDYAEKALGEKFDVKHFHNLILLEGPLPMPLLEKKIKAWVKSV